MKAIVVALIISFSFQLSAQVCKPDPNIPDTAFGVFPLPYDKDASPDGGISDSACFKQNFQFVWTANVGDSFPFGATKLPLDSLRMGKTGAVAGLPKGITYACDPPSCTFAKGTRGCVILKGIVSESTEIGDHELKLSGTLYANGSPSGLKLSFPSPLIAPGKYTLSVLPENDAKCKAQSVQSTALANWTIFPNPSNGTFSYQSTNSNLIGHLSIYSSTGKTVMKLENLSGNDNQFILTEPGIYFAVLRVGNQISTKQLVVE